MAELREGAAELAYAATGPEPRPELRERILRAAREERPATVIPFRSRWLLPMSAVAAAAAAVAAIGLGLWANSLQEQVDRQRVVAMQGGGQLLIDGERAAILSCVEKAPAGRTYEAWVIRENRPRPAGLFGGGCGTVELTEPVDPGDTVAVTLEAAGGVETPQGEVLMSADV